MDFALGQDLGAQATLMDESFEDFRVRLFGKVVAWFTEADAAELHVADGEFVSGQCVEVHTSGDEIAAGIVRGERDAVLLGECFDEFLLDERDLEVRFLWLW